MESDAGMYQTILPSNLTVFNKSQSTNESYVHLWKVLLPVTGLSAFASFVGNFLIILSIIRFKRLQTVTNIFLLPLGVSDGILSLNLLISFFFLDLIHKHGEFACLCSRICPLTASIIISALMLLAIIVERYIAILHPLRYPMIVTKQRAVIGTIVTCVLSTLVGFLPVFGWNNISLRPAGYLLPAENCLTIFTIPGSYMAFIFAVAIPACTLMTLLSGRIFFIAFQQSNQIHAISKRFRTGQPSKQKSGFIVLVAMVLLYQLAYLPMTLVHTINYRWFSKEVFYLKDDVVGEFPMILGYTLAIFNSAINPWLYCLGNTQMKQAVKSLLPRMKRQLIEGSMWFQMLRNLFLPSHRLDPTKYLLSQITIFCHWIIFEVYVNNIHHEAWQAKGYGDKK